MALEINSNEGTKCDSAAIGYNRGTMAVWTQLNWNSTSGNSRYICDTDTSRHLILFNGDTLLTYTHGITGTVLGVDRPAFSTGDLIHIVYRYDITGDVQEVIWNGTPLTIASTGTYGDVGIGTNFNIGISAAGANSGNQDIQNFATWDSRLDDEEVASLYAGASPALVRPSELIAYWPLNGPGDGWKRSVVGEFPLVVDAGTPTAISSVMTPREPLPQTLFTPSTGAPAGTRPQGPLWHPFAGPFQGPIG